MIRPCLPCRTMWGMYAIGARWVQAWRRRRTRRRRMRGTGARVEREWCTDVGHQGAWLAANAQGSEWQSVLARHAVLKRHGMPESQVHRKAGVCRRAVESDWEGTAMLPGSTPKQRKAINVVCRRGAVRRKGLVHRKAACAEKVSCAGNWLGRKDTKSVSQRSHQNR